MSDKPAGIIRVGTLNLRNTSDRWGERYQLIVDQLADLGPDIIGLQELRRPSLQRRMLLRGANQDRPPGSSPYALHTAWKTGLRRFWEGIAVLTELPVERHDWLPLGSERVAQRVRVRLADGSPLDFFNTHLHHSASAELLRLVQVERILAWMRQEPDIPQVFVGDFNARPESAVITLAKCHLRSAYEVHHGREPSGTVPAPVHQRFGDEDESVIDFIFVNDRINVHGAWLAFDRVHPDDDRLSASDHYGLIAALSIRPSSKN